MRSDWTGAFLTVVLVFAGGCLAACICGFSLCVAYGGTWTSNARPAPDWTLLLPIASGAIGGVLTGLWIRASDRR